MKKLAKALFLLVLPILISGVSSTFIGLILIGWAKMYAVVYMPIIATFSGILFLIAGMAWKKLAKRDEPMSLHVFLYGFYFGCAAICTLILISTPIE